MSPVCVGAGKRLFTPEAPPTSFTVTEQRVTSTGGTYTVLTPAAFTAGRFEVVDGKSA